MADTRRPDGDSAGAARLREVSAPDNFWDDTPPAPVGAPTPPSRFLRGVVSVVTVFTVLLLLLGAVTLLHRPGIPGPHALPTSSISTPTPTPPTLVWRQATLPPGVMIGVGSVPGSSPSGTGAADAPYAALAVAPSNGAIAYLCTAPTTGAPKLWRTLDAGQTWAPLPSPPDGGFVFCSLLIDQNNPLNVLASFSITPDPTASQVSSGYPSTYALLAGAPQWQQLNGGPYAFSTTSHFASWQGNYYATITISTPTSLQSTLSVSTDGMRSWQPIDRQIIVGDTLAHPGELGEVGFWVNSVTGALLAQTYNSTRTGELWMSVDHGVNWREVVLPPSPVSEKGETGDWVTGAALWVQQLASGRAFQLCASYTEKSFNGDDPFYCSNNGGQTWTKTSGLYGGGTDVYGLMPDGTLLVRDGTMYTLLPVNDSLLQTPINLGSTPSSVAQVYLSYAFGLTTRGMVLWQPDGEASVYVASYTLPDE